MASKYVDTIAIMQVIGSVYKNPQLLDITEKYIITEEDFSDSFHKIVFGAIFKLHELGATKITLENISDFLSSRQKSEAIYKTNKGEEWLLKVAENSQISSFDYYYGRLKKFSLLRAYDNCGVDVSDIYDIDNILDTKKKQLQEEQLDNLNLEQIADKVNEKIDNIRMQYVDDTFGESQQAGEGIFELIEKFKNQPEVGVPLYGPLINTATRGARLKKFYLRSAATGIGKAIPNSTLIPTPTGWKKVGEIKPGDKLFGQDGKETTVLQIHPQPHKKEIWKVTFADGRTAQCCGEHLWEYRYESHRGYGYRVEDIQTIYNRALTLKNGLKNSDGKGYRFHIKLNKPVEYEEKQYYLPPYVMGALLGDGSFRYDSSNKSLEFSSDNEDVPMLISLELERKWQKGKIKEFTIYPKKSSDFNYNWTFSDKENPKHPFWVEEMLKEYPELWNIKSEDKFIPKDYLQGSIIQRQSLLQGLMDTDGSVDEKGRTNFTTISPRLRDDFIELCRSLGFIATYSIDKRDKYTTGECYTIHIQAPKEMKQYFFRYAKKFDKMNNYIKNNKREEYKDHLAIVNIEKTTELSDMTCFTVDNDDHLFLMNDFITTHNTRSMIADACNIACNRIYDDTFGWIGNGVSEPVLFITTEQELEEIQTMMLAFLSGVNEEHILNGEYEDGEEKRIFEAGEILKNSPLYIEELPDFSLKDVEDKIKKGIRENDVKYVFHDYIHTSMKILEEITRRSGGVRLREDNILFMLSTRLKDICNQYGVFIMSATQLNGDYQTSETPDQNLLRGAKAIADKIDVGMILLGAKDEDLVKLQPILDSNIFEKPTIKISIYKNRRGRYKGVYLWCKADLGCCRIKPMFCTTYSYEMISIDDIRIRVDEENAFECED